MGQASSSPPARNTSTETPEQTNKRPSNMLIVEPPQPRAPKVGPLRTLASVSPRLGQGLCIFFATVFLEAYFNSCLYRPVLGYDWLVGSGLIALFLGPSLYIFREIEIKGPTSSPAPLVPRFVLTHRQARQVPFSARDSGGVLQEGLVFASAFDPENHSVEIDRGSGMLTIRIQNNDIYLELAPEVYQNFPAYIEAVRRLPVDGITHTTELDIIKSIWAGLPIWKLLRQEQVEYYKYRLRQTILDDYRLGLFRLKCSDPYVPDLGYYDLEEIEQRRQEWYVKSGIGARVEKWMDEGVDDSSSNFDPNAPLPDEKMSADRLRETEFPGTRLFYNLEPESSEGNRGVPEWLASWNTPDLRPQDAPVRSGDDVQDRNSFVNPSDITMIVNPSLLRHTFIPSFAQTANITFLSALKRKVNEMEAAIVHNMDNHEEVASSGSASDYDRRAANYHYEGLGQGSIAAAYYEAEQRNIPKTRDFGDQFSSEDNKEESGPAPDDYQFRLDTQQKSTGHHDTSMGYNAYNYPGNGTVRGAWSHPPSDMDDIDAITEFYKNAIPQRPAVYHEPPPVQAPSQESSIPRRSRTSGDRPMVWYMTYPNFICYGEAGEELTWGGRPRGRDWRPRPGPVSLSETWWEHARATRSADEDGWRRKLSKSNCPTLRIFVEMAERLIKEYQDSEEAKLIEEMQKQEKDLLDELEEMQRSREMRLQAEIGDEEFVEGSPEDEPIGWKKKEGLEEEPNKHFEDDTESQEAERWTAKLKEVMDGVTRKATRNIRPLGDIPLDDISLDDISLGSIDEQVAVPLSPPPAPPAPAPPPPPVTGDLSQKQKGPLWMATNAGDETFQRYLDDLESNPGSPLAVDNGFVELDLPELGVAEAADDFNRKNKSHNSSSGGLKPVSFEQKAADPLWMATNAGDETFQRYLDEIEQIEPETTGTAITSNKKSHSAYSSGSDKEQDPKPVVLEEEEEDSFWKACNEGGEALEKYFEEVVGGPASALATVVDEGDAGIGIDFPKQADATDAETTDISREDDEQEVGTASLPLPPLPPSPSPQLEYPIPPQ